MLAVVLVSFSSVFLVERVGLAWHAAREARRRHRRTLLGMLHEALVWAPMLLAIESRSPAAVAVAAVIAVGVASEVSP